MHMNTRSEWFPFCWPLGLVPKLTFFGSHNPVRLLALVAALTVCATAVAEEIVPLSSLDISKMSAGWGKPLANRSIQSEPLSIAGRHFEQGVGSHAPSTLWVDLKGTTKRFTAWVGVDDEVGLGRGSIEFRIVADNSTLFRSKTMKGGDPPQRVDVDLTGKKMLLLIVRNGRDNNNFDHADWADALFHVAGKHPEAVDGPSVPKEPKVILTPHPSPKPQIHGPRLFGGRPRRPMIYRIPCTGKRPLTFACDNLPSSLKIDPASGIISGSLPKQPGRHVVTLRATNDLGTCRKQFTMVVGDTLALTPPMGWNSWYIHYGRVTEQHMRQAADQMVRTGMADYGYMYVNIDDCWMKQKGDIPYRDKAGATLPNGKFPDITGMVSYIHGKGLRAGLYTSPGPWTCAGYLGAFEHEEIDAKKFAEWGFDFLKYDWCSYGRVAQNKSLAELKKPYLKMGGILRTLDRDLVFNLCQYGMGDVWKWGPDVEGNCWRTTGDLGLARGSELPGFYSIGFSNARHWKYARPGYWNDPDYILIGWVGAAHGQTVGHPTTLTGNEQYSYMSMWCLMAAPLIFSGDMAKLDAFTLNVLCNAEVIDVDQDALGKQARIVRQDDDTLILAKPMEDGSLAVGLFNLNEAQRSISVTWQQLGISDRRKTRDLWRQIDLGSESDHFTAQVPRHGVSMVRLFPIGSEQK